MKKEDIQNMAIMIAKDIFEVGSEPNNPVQRIQFLSGEYPDNEKPQGGLCEVALAMQIKTSLTNYLAA